MIVISVGMQKSGSAFIYNLINDLLAASGHCDAREIKKIEQLDEVLLHHNNNINSYTVCKMLRLYRVSLRRGIFVVKSHKAPNLVLRLFDLLGYVKIIYSYRDPRDVVLSVMDHGKKIQSEGKTHSFARYTEFDSATMFVKRQCRIWKQYSKMNNIKMVRYEDVSSKPEVFLSEAEDYLGIRKVSDMVKDRIAWKYAKNNPDKVTTGLHFNKANVRRFEKEMSQAEKTKCEEQLRQYLTRMPYV